MNQEHDEIEIDLREIFYLLKQKIAVILSVTLIFGVVAGLYTYYVIEPQYSSTAKIYVLSKSDTVLSFSDLNLGSGLATDYVELIKSRPVMEKVIENLKLNMSYEDILELVSITNPSDTRILNITVEYTDPLVAEKIANDIVEVSKTRISEIMHVDEPTIVEKAISTGEKVYPSNVKNTIIAALVGLLLSSGIFITIYLLDDKVKTSDDIERYLGLNTLALIPDDMDGVKGANKKSTWKSMFRRKED